MAVLSVTDHDTTAGLPGCASEAARLGLAFIPGIEITAVDNGEPNDETNPDSVTFSPPLTVNGKTITTASVLDGNLQLHGDCVGGN